MAASDWAPGVHVECAEELRAASIKHGAEYKAAKKECYTPWERFCCFRAYRMVWKATDDMISQKHGFTGRLWHRSDMEPTEAELQSEYQDWLAGRVIW